MNMERLRELRLAKGESQEQLAKILGVSRTSYTKYENGQHDPSMEALDMLAEHFNVSIDYLLGRQATMDSPTPSVPGSKWIPVLGAVAAGVPIEAIEDIEDYEEISPEMAASGDYFALRIKGDSMEPRIHTGDVVIVRRQCNCETGEIAVVLVNGDEATVKRIKKRPEGLMLIPNNPAYEPMFYSAEEVQKLPVQILGKVVELRAKF